MGTNFYAHRKLKTREKQEIHQKLDDLLEGKIDDDEFVYYLLEQKTKKIHLGKRSYGWQFLWQNQPDYYQDNLASIMEFLLTEDYIIKDEYGEIFEFQDFLDNEIGDALYSGYTHDSYIRDHPDKDKIPSQYHDWITSDRLRFANGDFS